jgi:hypothetical protein
VDELRKATGVNGAAKSGAKAKAKKGAKASA